MRQATIYGVRYSPRTSRCIAYARYREIAARENPELTDRERHGMSRNILMRVALVEYRVDTFNRVPLISPNDEPIKTTKK